MGNDQNFTDEEEVLILVDEGICSNVLEAIRNTGHEKKKHFGVLWTIDVWRLMKKGEISGGKTMSEYKEFESKMQKACDGLQAALATIRAGRANANVINQITTVISAANGNIENTFHHSVRRIDMKINVEYGTDAQKCIDLLLSLVKSDARVLDASVAGAKEPSAFLSELSASTVEFTVWYWVRIEDYWNVKFDMNSLVYTELPKNGISFAYPHMDIELRNGSR